MDLTRVSTVDAVRTFVLTPSDESYPSYSILIRSLLSVEPQFHCIPRLRARTLLRVYSNAIFLHFFYILWPLVLPHS